MKKSVNPFTLSTLGLMSLTMSLSLLASSTSQASLLAAATPLAISDAVFEGLGGVLLVSGLSAGALSLSKHKDSKTTKSVVRVFLATFVLVAILDDSGNQKIVLQPVSEDLAAKSGLSAQEAQAYNGELEIAQQVLDQISSEVAQAPEQDRVAVAKASWEKYRGMLSADAFNGLMKLTASAAN